MGRPEVADRGHGVQIWNAAENILNKQLRKAELWWSSSSEVHRKTSTL